MGSGTAVILGHSHVSAITGAIANRRELGLTSGIDFFCINAILRPGFLNYASIIDGQRVFNPDILAEVDAAVPPAKQALFAAVFGGNAYNAVGLIQAKPDFDFYVYGEPFEPIDGGLALVPAYLVRQRLLIEAAAALEHVSLLQGLGRGKVVCLGSPPPIEDNDRIRDVLEASFKEGRDDWTIARPSLRRKLWLLHTEIFRTHCGLVGVEFVPCPPQAVSSSGFLRQELCADATHGNALYGEFVLQQLMLVLGHH